MKIIYLFLTIVFLLTGCDVQSDRDQLINRPKTATVILTWDPTTEYEDGSPITGLKEYRVYYGDDPNFLKKEGKVLKIPGGKITTASLFVPKGIWYFAVTAVDPNEIESDLSNIVVYTVKL